MTFFHWLGSEAEAAAVEHETAEQRAREVSLIVDTSEIDE